MNFAKLDDYLKVIEEKFQVPMGDVQVMKGHDVLYRNRFGYADADKKIPLTENHLFRLYSCSKVVTMTAVMQLIERGQLRFHDRLSDYLPEYDAIKVLDSFDLQGFGNVAGDLPSHIAHNEIKIIDLMTMSAGFSYDTKDPNILAAIKDSNGDADTRMILKYLAKTPLLYEPGTRFCYSLAHDVLVGVVEVITGMKFSDYLKKNIFEPIGAKDFYYDFKGVKEVQSRLCDIYVAGDDGQPPFRVATPERSDSYSFTKKYESGGAGLIGTVDSYSRLAEALACGGMSGTGNRILKPETVELFTHPYAISGKLRDDFGVFNRVGYQYGLGVRVMVDNSKAKSPVGEFGWDGAAGAYVLIDTTNEISIFYAQHTLGFGTVYDVIHPNLRDVIYECIEG